MADTGNHTIRIISASNVSVTTLAGNTLTPTFGFTDGAGQDARFNSPVGLVRDGVNLYVADSGNNTVRRIETVTRNVTTLAGAANTPPGSADGTGTVARFSNPSGITTDGTSLYVTDTDNHTIRRIQ